LPASGGGGRSAACLPGGRRGPPFLMRDGGKNTCVGKKNTPGSFPLQVRWLPGSDTRKMDSIKKYMRECSSTAGSQASAQERFRALMGGLRAENARGMPGGTSTGGTLRLRQEKREKKIGTGPHLSARPSERSRVSSVHFAHPSMGTRGGGVCYYGHRVV